MSYLQVQDIHKSYSKNNIFSQINLNVEVGEFITLLGPSGCGKSTLLRCIAGLTNIDSGLIFLNQRNITNLTPQKRRIAMVFQSYALFPNMTVKQNVAFGLKMSKQPKYTAPQIQHKVDKILALVELSEFTNRYPHQLSGGQCQRVALARALVVEPDLLLLDEPLSALDARIRKHLRNEIKQIQQSLNLTTIFVTHDQEEALQMSDRIILMEQGRIIQNTTPEQIYYAPNNHFAASFIGNYNILTAEQISKITQQQIAHEVAVRPEIIQLSTTPINNPSAWQITHKQLLGNIMRYQVVLDDLQLTVDQLNIAHSYAEKQPIFVDIPLSLVHTLAKNSAPTS